MSALELSDTRFRYYIQNKKILVADTNPRILEHVAELLLTMGIPKMSLVFGNSFDSARNQISQHKPEIVLSDYDLDKKCGLGLIQLQRKNLSQLRDGLFLLVTANTSQIAVARAAEEEVDGYVLKPFTGGILRDAILKAAASRYDPSDYEKLIEEGKTLIASLALDEAEKTLEQARTKHPNPALALYYLGQIELTRKNYKKAQERFQTGLKSNRIHYKCLVGLYESYYEQKEFSEAYSTLRKVSRYFPLEPSHLASMLKMAIQTKTYEDIERLYRIFSALEEKSEELVKYVCAALVVCGKYYLQKTIRSRSLELFQYAIRAAEKNPRILKEVILILADAKLKKEIELFIQFFPPQTRDSNDYQIARLALSDLTFDAASVIMIGEELLNKECHDPFIYMTLIRRNLETLNPQKAASLAKTATQKWPELQEKIQTLMTTLGATSDSSTTH